MIHKKNQGQTERSKTQKRNLPEPQKHNHSSSAKPFRKTNPQHTKMMFKERKKNKKKRYLIVVFPEDVAAKCFQGE
jgi:hypothetical protein